MTTGTEIVLFEPDLLFSSKVEGAAKRLNVELRVITDLAELLRDFEGSASRVFVISLDALEGKLSALKNHMSGRPRVIGYYSHVDRKSTRLNSSHSQISYAVFCLK